MLPGVDLNWTTLSSMTSTESYSSLKEEYVLDGLGSRMSVENVLLML